MREECGDFPSCLELFHQEAACQEKRRERVPLQEADGGEEIMELQKTNLEKEFPNCDDDKDDLIEDKVISALRHSRCRVQLVASEISFVDVE